MFNGVLTLLRGLAFPFAVDGASSSLELPVFLAYLVAQSLYTRR